jgi:hypothetical protein
MLPVTCRFRDPFSKRFHRFFRHHGKLGHNGVALVASNVRLGRSVPEKERDYKNTNGMLEDNVYNHCF